MSRLRSGVFVMVALLVSSGCKDEKSDGAARADAVVDERPPATFEGLEIEVGDTLKVAGDLVKTGVHPPSGKKRSVVPGLAEMLSTKDGVASLAARGVLVRVHPAVPYLRVSQILHTLDEQKLPMTHFAVGDGVPVAATTTIKGEPVFVTVNARGIGVVSAGELVPPQGDCPPGPSFCWNGDGTIQASATDAQTALRKGDTKLAEKAAESAAKLVPVPNLQKRFAAFAKTEPAPEQLAVAAHAFVPASVVAAVISANCAAGEGPVCQPQLEQVALTILR